MVVGDIHGYPGSFGRILFDTKHKQYAKFHVRFQLQLHCDHYRDQSHYAICIKRIFNFKFSYQTLPHTAPPKKSFFIPLVCKLFAPPMASVRTITVYLTRIFKWYSNLFSDNCNDIGFCCITLKILFKVVQESRPIQSL